MIELHFYTNCDYIFDHTRIYLFFFILKASDALDTCKASQKNLKMLKCKSIQNKSGTFLANIYDVC